MAKTFVDLIQLTPGRSGKHLVDNIVASMNANRVENNGQGLEDLSSSNTCFQLRLLPGLEIEEGMVLVCETGRYNIKEVKNVENNYLEAWARKVEI